MPDFSKGMEIALNAALKALGLQKEHILEPIQQVRSTFEEINARLASMQETLARLESRLNEITHMQSEVKSNGLFTEQKRIGSQ